MLSRVAASLYRLGRELERADHLARSLDVHLSLSLDQEPRLEDNFWSGFLSLSGRAWIAGVNGREAAALVVEDAEGPSVKGALAAARAAAQGVRPSLSSEVWEQLNGLHWRVQDADWAHGRHEFLSSVQTGIHLITGLIEDTMAHDESWDFLRLGRYLERAANVTRLVTSRAVELGEQSVDTVEWAAVLRCCSGYEAYRWHRSLPPSPQAVVGYLLFEPQLPRSAVFSLESALASIMRIDGPDLRSAPHRILGRLASRFQYADAAEVTGSPRDYQRRFEVQAEQLADAIRDTYFDPSQLQAGSTRGEMISLQRRRQPQQQ